MWQANRGPEASRSTASSGDAILPPHHPGPPRAVDGQPGPGPRTARRVSGGPARVGMALPQAALPGRAGRPPGRRPRSTAWRSAPTANGSPPRAGTGPSRSGTARPARSSRLSTRTPTLSISVAFHPDGKHLASAGADRKVKVWDWTTGGERCSTCPCDAVHNRGTAYAVAFSPDGRRLAVGKRRGRERLGLGETEQLLVSPPRTREERRSAWRSVPTGGASRRGAGGAREDLGRGDRGAPPHPLRTSPPRQRAGVQPGRPATGLGQLRPDA